MSLESLLRPIKNKITSMIGLCIIKGAKLTDNGITLKVDILADETRDEIDMFQQYGFSSMPLEGATGVSMFIAGSRDNGVVIATKDSRYLLEELEGGEVALHTDEGDKIHFKRGRVISIETETLEVSASKKVVFDTPIVESTGELKDSGGELSRLRDNYNSHKHVGNLGAPTSPPDSPDVGL